jgi:chromosome segregation ATPase
MIKKIKNLMAINEQIEVVNNTVKEHSKSVEQLKETVSALQTSMHEMKSNNEEFAKLFSQNLNIINTSKEELKKEIYDFKLLKTQMQKKLLEKFETELGNHLCINSEKLQNDLNEYNQLKDKVSSTITNIEGLSLEINKFSDISKSIKKEDFELTQFNKQMQDTDKEKLELMRKIDNLERLIAKMRRR